MIEKEVNVKYTISHLQKTFFMWLLGVHPKPTNTFEL